MRLWTINPCYLDVQGLSGLWREGLLAKKVLKGLTKGYKNHPQLNRFYNHENQNKAIDCYLYYVLLEAQSRGYSFDASKINPVKVEDIIKITTTIGQVNFEINHLENKLKHRSMNFFEKMNESKIIKTHPLFKIINGPIESWEKKSK